MKTTINFGFIILLLHVTVLSQAQQTINLPAPTPYSVVQRDANSQVWERTVYEVGPSGQAVPRVRSYTELATGLNFMQNGQYVPSQEEIDLLPQGGAAATKGQHQVYFPNDIYEGVIELVTPDGKQLQSRPLGISYDDGNGTVMIAALTNSVGMLVAPNQVIYPNAFYGLNADLRYTYTKAGFEQDVILHEQPPAPEAAGLNPATTRLQVLTEFFNPPQPNVTPMSLPAQAGIELQDESLDFGVMKMMQGRAFLFGADAKDMGIWVGKNWLLSGWKTISRGGSTAGSVGGPTDSIASIPIRKRGSPSTNGVAQVANAPAARGKRPLCWTHDSSGSTSTFSTESGIRLPNIVGQ